MLDYTTINLSSKIKVKKSILVCGHIIISTQTTIYEKKKFQFYLKYSFLCDMNNIHAFRNKLMWGRKIGIGNYL